MKFKKGDEAVIVIGKDKGKKGKIEKVFSKKNMILIPGVNQYKRHVKARTQNDKSEIITITKPIRLSKAQLVCPNCSKPTRVGYKVAKEGKVRICKKCGKEI